MDGEAGFDAGGAAVLALPGAETGLAVGCCRGVSRAAGAGAVVGRQRVHVSAQVVLPVPAPSPGRGGLFGSDLQTQRGIAQADQIAVFQHLLIVKAQVIDPGAVGAVQILDVVCARGQAQAGMAARDHLVIQHDAVAGLAAR